MPESDTNHGAITQAKYHMSPAMIQAARIVRFLGSSVLAAAAACALTVNVAFYESFDTARLSVVLAVLVLLQFLLFPRIPFYREFVLYAWLVAYLFVELLWTRDVVLAMNTLIPATNFLLILILFSSLVIYHSIQATLVGMLVGFLIGAGAYSSVKGFPFVRPADLSYNAIAGMYLFGLFVTLLLGSYKRSKATLPMIAFVLLLLVVATTSIKASLGVLLGAIAGGIVYFRHFVLIFWRNAILLVTLSGILGFAVVSSDSLLQRLQAGMNRAVLGIELLQARENLPGYGGADRRTTWLADGLEGWAQNPVFGHGVEAFRAQYGTTSHSTVVDLLYNSGLVGFSLFYLIFLSLVWRLFSEHGGRFSRIRALILAGTVCYLFMTLSGTMHYNAFLAVFIAISTGVLALRDRQHSAITTSVTVSRS